MMYEVMISSISPWLPSAQTDPDTADTHTHTHTHTHGRAMAVFELLERAVWNVRLRAETVHDEALPVNQ